MSAATGQTADPTPAGTPGSVASTGGPGGPGGEGGPGPRRPFFPEFEGLRAVAALLVVMVHTTFASGFTLRSSVGDLTARGDSGVSVFFLISGFLLYRPFVAARVEGRAAPDLRSFLVRRVLRIVPLYWVVLTVLYTVNGWDGVGGVQGVARTYLFAQVYSIPWVLKGISQAWSLDVEVVFYLLLPLWSAGVGRLVGRGGTPRRLLTVELLSLAGLYLAGLAFHTWVLVDPMHATATWHGWFPTWADMFALGMALAVASEWTTQHGHEPRWATLPGADVLCWAAAAGVFVLLATGIGLRTDPLYVGAAHVELAGHALSGLFALLLLLPAVFGRERRGPVRWLLTWRPVAAVGLVSYGVYLWHQLVIAQLLKHGFRQFDAPYLPFLGATLGITLVLSAVTYLLVERPGVGVGHRWLRRRREQLVSHEAPAGG